MSATPVPIPNWLYPKVIQCFDCGAEFVWTVGEQELYARHHFHPPKRCQRCRDRRRRERKGWFGKRS